MCQNGEVYISKKVDVYDLLDSGDDEQLMELVEAEIVQHYQIEAFNKDFIPSLKYDLRMLEELHDEWEEIVEDPKKEQFLLELKERDEFKNNKIIIFTESTETAEYVGAYLELYYPEQVLIYSGQSSRSIRQEIEANFNPNYVYEKRNDIKFLVTTDVLAEGINLHRSNVIVNYDLPWNPTKVMQRVGRINRVGTEHERLYVFNFFPADQANAHLPLEENIKLKIQAFHDTLGEDFKYLSEDEEISSHNLYQKLSSKESLEADETEEQSELKYLNILRDIRDKHEELYEKIKRLPQKSKSGRLYAGIEKDNTITFLRKGALKKFFISDGTDTEEIPFMQALKYLEVSPEEKKIKPPKAYFDHLELNKTAFKIALSEEEELITEKAVKTGNDAKVVKLLKAISRCKAFTDEQEILIEKMRKAWEDGNIPASITKDVLKQTRLIKDPIKVFYEIIDIVPEKYLEARKRKKAANISGDMKVILSSYLKKEGKE